MSDRTSVALREVQSAMFDLLNGEIGYQVYDEVPAAGAKFPYVTFGDPSEGVMEARGVKGRLVYLPLHVHSRGAGGKFECYTAMAAIVEKMTEAKLAMKAWQEVWKTYQTGKVVAVEKDPGAYFGIVQFLIAVCKST